MGMHSFSLILSGVNALNEEIENSLFEAGCDDCLPAARAGVVFLEFDREAKSFNDAVESAIRNVNKAGLDVARIEPDDFVTQAEIARRLERTREGVRLMMQGERGPGKFPLPVAAVTTKSPLWSWHDVAGWCLQNTVCDNAAVKNAEILKRLNAQLAGRKHRR